MIRVSRVQMELEVKWGSVDSSVPSGDSDVLTTEGFAAWVEQFCYRQSTVTCVQSPGAVSHLPPSSCRPPLSTTHNSNTQSSCPSHSRTSIMARPLRPSQTMLPPPLPPLALLYQLPTAGRRMSVSSPLWSTALCRRGRRSAAAALRARHNLVHLGRFRKMYRLRRRIITLSRWSRTS